LLVFSLVALIRRAPLSWVARLGRMAGGLAYWIDSRHRKVALSNLALWLGRGESRSQIRAIARENFRRLGENYASALKTAYMSWQELEPHVEYVGWKKFQPLDSHPGAPPQGRVFAIGHFGNFELYARAKEFLPMRCVATYRGLKNPLLDRLLLSMRSRSGCQFFERRTEAGALRAAMREPGTLLGLLSDQNAGGKGVKISFLGHECSASPAPAIFALRYRVPLHTAICYRTALARWRIEVGEEIPTRIGGKPRPVEEITADVHRAFEAAIRRDPANWFWVHDRWKYARRKRLERAGSGKHE
jgi:KDO2-lipid IV(A) lauroyltransferase